MVGAILHQTSSGSDLIAGAHVAAVCARADAAVVITSDPGDVRAMAATGPGTRIITRSPVAPDRGVTGVPDSSGVGEVTERPKVIAC